jgi:5-methylcytosine-specific restriction endonuclease McrA
VAPPRKYHTEEERKAAQRARSAAWYAANRERALAMSLDWQAANYDKIRERRSTPEYRAKKAAYAKAHRAANPEENRARSRAYYAANRDKVVAAQAAWKAANPDKIRNIQNTRRAKKLGAQPDLTGQQWREILEEFDNCCAYCQARGVRLEQEHMTPLSRGGRHTKSNVVPACRSCNARKNTKTLFEFAALG